METFQIPLASNESKKSKNSSLGISINLSGKQRAYTDTDVVGTINAFDQYTEERSNCNKVRLVCPINSVCSNVLFNPVTEVVRDEGTDNAVCLNYTPLRNDEIGEKQPLKPTKNSDKPFEWNAYEAVRDTQLSSNDFGFDYHCGVDFFNNHLLRANTFKIVSYNKTNSKKPVTINTINAEHVYLDENFNTIDDWMRDANGNVVFNNFWNPIEAGNAITYYTEPGKIKLSNTNKDIIPYSFNVDFYVRKDVDSITNLLKQLPQIELWIEFTYKFEHGFVGRYQGSGSYSIVNDKFTVNVVGSGPSNRIDGGSIFHVIDNGDNKTVPTINSVTIKSSTSLIEDYEWVLVPKDVILDNIVMPSHLYQSFDADSYDYTVTNKLIEENGWFGFKNVSRLPSYDTDTGEYLDISKPINSKMAGTFIDMYPTRDLYSFKPKYNDKRKRIEKNWDYCITYPFSSTTRGINFIDNVTKGLKILMFDEFIKDDSQKEVITFYCVSQHGLNVGNYVNIYTTVNNTSRLLITNAEVADVYNKYIFQIYKNGISLSNHWYGWGEDEDTPTSFVASISGENRTYQIDVGGYKYYLRKNKKYYILPDSNKVNLDENVLNLSFKKVENNIECQYYVRLFSKLPNFKFSSDEVNENTIYDKNLLAKYRTNEYAFENHINSLGFAKNIYGDPISEIVFTDDIDLSYLKDNLGRPLSDIYLTIIKRNKGYKEWYGIKGRECDVKNSKIEYSHCFGKNTCGFRLSDESLEESNMAEVRKLGNYGDKGLNMQSINSNNYSSFDESDEVDMDYCDVFYGDLCCYSPSEASESIIQPVMDRFNTAQRELNQGADMAFSAFSNIVFDDIENDENSVGYADSYNLPHSIQDSYSALPRKEGYYYRMHYNIPIRTVSDTLSTTDAIQYQLTSLTLVSAISGLYRMCTKVNNYFSLNDKVVLYNTQNDKAYNCVVDRIITGRKFECVVYNENNTLANISDIADLSYFVILTKDDTTPLYANLLMDGSLKYCWREIINNGEDNADDIEIYPFANGAFYVNRPINLYLRRQDPYGDIGLKITKSASSDTISYEHDGERLPDIQENNYVEKKDMKEC